jgi:hypothetical protein
MSIRSTRKDKIKVEKKKKSKKKGGVTVVECLFRFGFVITWW